MIFKGLPIDSGGGKGEEKEEKKRGATPGPFFLGLESMRTNGQSIFCSPGYPPQARKPGPGRNGPLKSFCIWGIGLIIIPIELIPELPG
jgi:hypothetical protein